MEQKYDTILKYYKYSKILYLRDINEIFRILERISYRVKISTDKFTYDTVEELKNNEGNVFDKLTFEINKPFPLAINNEVDVSISPDKRETIIFGNIVISEEGLTIFISHDKLEVKGAIEEIFNILDNCENTKRTIIYLLNEEDVDIEHSLWERTKDNLFVAIISAIIGTVIGSIGTILVQIIIHKYKLNN
jgi:hypothetical protein